MVFCRRLTARGSSEEGEFVGSGERSVVIIEDFELFREGGARRGMWLVDECEIVALAMAGDLACSESRSFISPSSERADECAGDAD